MTIYKMALCIIGQIYLYFIYLELGGKARNLHMLGKCSMTKLYLQAHTMEIKYSTCGLFVTKDIFPLTKELDGHWVIPNGSQGHQIEPDWQKWGQS